LNARKMYKIRLGALLLYVHTYTIY
jgi:hypothetical protein